MYKFRKGFYFDNDPAGGGGPPPATPPADQSKTPGSEPGKEPGKDPDPVPYLRFKEVNDNYAKLKEEHDKMIAEQESEKTKKLEEDKKWEDLYKQEQEKNKANEKKLKRLEVAQKKGLPVEFADRLQGETEQELEADADKLLAFVDTSKSPGLPPKGANGQVVMLDVNNMTPDEIRTNAGKILDQAKAGTK